MGSTNFIVYLREDIKPEDKAKIAGWNLSDIVKQLGIPEGRVVSHDRNTVSVSGTSNAVGASLKMTLGQWCVVESFVEVHPRLTKDLGPLARGG